MKGCTVVSFMGEKLSNFLFFIFFLSSIYAKSLTGILEYCKALQNEMLAFSSGLCVAGLGTKYYLNKIRNK